MRAWIPAAIVLAMSACASETATMTTEPSSSRANGVDRAARREVRHGEIFATEHRGDDDLLTAGLGRDGLFALTPPKVAVPDAPTHAELRRRAIYANWRGIAALSAPAYADLPSVPGREFHTFVSTPGAKHTHRVMVQVPDGFDRAKRCLVVSAASGSRGVYGSIAVAAPWALPNGCAVAYTDKGAGSGFFDFDSNTGVALDGTRAEVGSADLEFVPETTGATNAANRIATKHAHSKDNPEQHWGHYTLDAARFGLEALDRAFPDLAPFTAENTRIIAVGISNGGGAVLLAGEQDDEGLLDAVVAGEPNVLPPQGRSLFDIGSEIALYQPCLLLALPNAPALMPEAAWKNAATARCANLREQGLVGGDTPEAQAKDALARMRAAGWEEAPLMMSGVHVATDLWRAVLATYAPAYLRADAGQPICGYSFAAVSQPGVPRAAPAAERALWWADGSGIPPTANVAIVDTLAQQPDATFAALRCMREIWLRDSPESKRMHESIEATRSTAKPRVPTYIVHGTDDSLIPIAFTSRPYVEAARANGAAIDYVEIPRAQHFDAFISLPALSTRYVPLLPELYKAMDKAFAALQR